MREDATAWNRSESCDFLGPHWGGLAWSDWWPLDKKLPRGEGAGPGFYRIKRVDRSALVYVGQTGRDLRERVSALRRNVFRENPPWNDPHTAAPCLWAWRLEDGLSYEVSWASDESAYAQRQCREDQLLFMYRCKVGESTLGNHGRFHSRWLRPSNKAAGRAMIRLGEGQHNLASGPSLSPVVLCGSPGSPDWLGLPWSKFLSTVDLPKNTAGVYRLRAGEEVVYLGQSACIKSRFDAHRKKFRRDSLTISFTEIDGALGHQLLEREVDLIGAFFTRLQRPPRFQYRKNENC